MGMCGQTVQHPLITIMALLLLTPVMPDTGGLMEELEQYLFIVCHLEDLVVNLTLVYKVTTLIIYPYDIAFYSEMQDFTGDSFRTLVSLMKS